MHSLPEHIVIGCIWAIALGALVVFARLIRMRPGMSMSLPPLLPLVPLAILHVTAVHFGYWMAMAILDGVILVAAISIPPREFALPEVRVGERMRPHESESAQKPSGQVEEAHMKILRAVSHPLYDAAVACESSGAPIGGHHKRAV